ncbi:class II aldolase/adducin family protein [Arthrobacter sp. NPDC056691]|uniref:class II aldolase/adducin family protein n=1 Tax=Arthrobacter sp. NPDC056691 TaxID=3345913 RepID=UPI00366EF5BF
MEFAPTEAAYGEVTATARGLARAGLVDAFGHVSVRTSVDQALLTPPVPLAWLTADDAPADLSLGAVDLPDKAPKEAWIHIALYERHAEAGAVCRAQPRAVAAMAALGRVPAALNGHAAMIGPIALYPDSRLIRDRHTAETLVSASGDARAIMLRGNGAVTWGRDAREALARMWILERAAELDLRASSAGPTSELPVEEQAWWRDHAAELLPRVGRYLTLDSSGDTTR